MSIYDLVVVVTVMSVITALGTSWLCFKAWRVSTTLTGAGDVAAAAAQLSHEDFIAALTRIESEVAEAKATSAHTAGRIDVGNELGFQNAAASHRMETHDAEVAHDLAESISRADANADPSPGASADAALRSGVTAEEIREEQNPTEEA